MKQRWGRGGEFVEEKGDSAAENCKGADERMGKVKGRNDSSGKKRVSLSLNRSREFEHSSTSSSPK